MTLAKQRDSLKVGSWPNLALRSPVAIFRCARG